MNFNSQQKTANKKIISSNDNQINLRKHRDQ